VATDTTQAAYTEGPAGMRFGAPRRCVEAMRSTVDERTLLTLVSDLEDLLADRVVFIPLFQRPHATAGWTDRVAGVVANPSLAGLTWGVGSWYRLDLMGWRLAMED
jgi:hypothetical protein